MRDGLHIFDADRHVLEPLNLWAEQLEPGLRRHAPRLGRLPEETLEERLARLGPQGLLPVLPLPEVDGKPLWNHMPEKAWLEFSARSYAQLGRNELLQRPDVYLAQMDRDGVDMAALFPTYALLLEGFSPLEPRVATAFASVYNTWLHGFCAHQPERLRGVGLISRHQPEAMVAEVRRVAGFGWRAVMVRPNPIGGRLLSDAAYEPFWSECEKLSLAVVLHGSGHVYVPSAGADRFDTRFANHVCAHPMELMMGLLALLQGGVLERHPALRIGAMEAGCGWLPYWAWRLDEEYRAVGAEVSATIRQLPSTYLRQHCFVSMEPDEPYLSDMVRHLPEDRLVFGSDFPHLDHGEDVLGAMLSLRDVMTESRLRKVLWENPTRFYGVEP
ncbi:amidohydrolase family protein [Corallococcus sp. AB038B]|uniref:amidohydrolase family protein n=1 Tax=Corallococcus sp. AB038B TaxID=2316718 RepID=UPI000ED53DB1|nr:amidohydrolase family protein [Corallococcus sp. AB038B]RKI01700.1 amidohydrolase [Corallococcus sp. AB038B]